MLKTVTRALDVLEFLSGERRAVSLTEIARRLRLNLSTTHHLLGTLKARGYVEQETNSSYRLGGRLFVVGAGAPVVAGVRELATPVMRQLAAQSGETVSLMIRDYQHGVCIYQIPSSNQVAVTGFVGQRFPLHCTATGKVLLAHMSPHEATRLLANTGLARFTSRTITDRDRLQRELTRVRRTGVAFDRGERTSDVLCAAAPVYDHTGDLIAAISLSGPAHRLSEIRLQEVGRLVRVGCEEISYQLGWTGRPETRGLSIAGQNAGA